MEATIAQLTREMEDARLTAEFCEKEQTLCEQKAEWWKYFKQEAHRIYYQKKLQLKTLTDAKPQL